MAKEKIDVKREMEVLLKEIVCGICKRHYKEPKVLPCSHYYCKKCILKSITKGTKRFTCPTCHFNTTLTATGTQSFLTPFFVTCFKEKYHLLEIAFCNGETTCEACEDSLVKAKGFCMDCSGFICDTCFTSHQHQKIYKTHCMTSLDNLDKRKFEEMISTKSTTCSEHKNTKNLYCVECCCFICDICKSNDHTGHKIETATDATSTATKELLKAFDSVKASSRKASDYLRKIKAMKQATIAQKDSVAATIIRSFDELHKIIENHKKNALEEIQMMVTENISELTKKETKFLTAADDIQKILNYTEKCLALSPDHNLLLNQAEIQNRLEQNVDINWGNDITEIEAHVSCNDELDTFLRDKTWISRRQLSSAASSQEKLLSNEVVEITLGEKCTIDLYSKCLDELPDVEDKHTMVRKNHGILYTPDSRGRYELTITVDGKEIASSPIPFLVSIPPTVEAKPFKVLSGFKRPIGVAVNSVGDIIVTQLQAGAIILNKEGVTKNIIDRSKKLSELVFSVAVDTNDSLYFSSQCTNEITKYDLTGNVYETYTVSQDHGPGHYAIAIIDDEVMLTERENEGTVRVYNKYVKFTRQISGTLTGKYFDISSDSNSNIYVTDHKNSRMCVQVFSNSGIHLSTFENNVSCISEPAYPCGIFVSGKYMYITNRKSAFVYTTDNEYVKSIAVKGSDEMTWPCGVSVCVDRHGFVYVCDYSSSEIVVY